MDTEKNHNRPGEIYKSPKSKLIKFFTGSRDKWKEKAKEAKYQVKLLRKKIKYSEQKKKELKAYSKKLEIKVQEMEKKEKQMQNEIGQLKKNLRQS